MSGRCNPCQLYFASIIHQRSVGLLSPSSGLKGTYRGSVAMGSSKVGCRLLPPPFPAYLANSQPVSHSPMLWDHFLTRWQAFLVQPALSVKETLTTCLPGTELYVAESWIWGQIETSLNFNFKTLQTKAAKMPPWLRALIALAEDLGSIPSSHTLAPIHL